MNECSFEKFKNYITVGEKFSANYFWNSKSQPNLIGIEYTEENDRDIIHKLKKMKNMINIINF